MLHNVHSGALTIKRLQKGSSHFEALTGLFLRPGRCPNSSKWQGRDEVSCHEVTLPLLYDLSPGTAQAALNYERSGNKFIETKVLGCFFLVFAELKINSRTYPLRSTHFDLCLQLSANVADE